MKKGLSSRSLLVELFVEKQLVIAELIVEKSLSSQVCWKKNSALLVEKIVSTSLLVEKKSLLSQSSWLQKIHIGWLEKLGCHSFVDCLFFVTEFVVTEFVVTELLVWGKKTMSSQVCQVKKRGFNAVETADAVGTKKNTFVNTTLSQGFCSSESNVGCLVSQQKKETVCCPTMCLEKTGLASGVGIKKMLIVCIHAQQKKKPGQTSS